MFNQINLNILKNHLDEKKKAHESNGPKSLNQCPLHMINKNPPLKELNSSDSVPTNNPPRVYHVTMSLCHNLLIKHKS